MVVGLVVWGLYKCDGGVCARMTRLESSEASSRGGGGAEFVGEGSIEHAAADIYGWSASSCGVPNVLVAELALVEGGGTGHTQAGLQHRVG